MWISLAEERDKRGPAMQYRYSVYYKFVPGNPPPLSAIFPKTPDEIIYALRHFKDDVVHHLSDRKARVVSSEPPFENDRMAVTITTTATRDEVEQAVVTACKALG